MSTIGEDGMDTEFSRKGFERVVAEVPGRLAPSISDDISRIGSTGSWRTVEKSFLIKMWLVKRTICETMEAAQMPRVRRTKLRGLMFTMSVMTLSTDALDQPSATPSITAAIVAARMET